MNVQVIDVHGHAGAWPQYGWYDRTPADGAGWMLRAMDRVGIDRQCIFHIFHSDARRGNRTTYEFVKGYPDRFVGVAFVSPHYPEECPEALAEAIDGFGFKAIKIYPPYGGVALNDPRWEPIFAFAEERRLPVISHTSGSGEVCGVHLFPEKAARYPDVSWILGHAGGDRVGREAACRAVQAVEETTRNIYVELCSSHRDVGSVEQLVEGAGADRVLFGSDNPLLDPRIHLGRVLVSDLTANEKRLILGGNAMRLLGL